MEENKILKELAGLKQEFKSDFHAKVIEKIAESRTMLQMQSLRFIAITSIAAVISMLVIVYYQTGEVNYDSLLGVSEYDPDNVTQYLDNLYNE